MAGIGNYKKGKKFTLKSGNTPLSMDKTSAYKLAGDSPISPMRMNVAEAAKAKVDPSKTKITKDNGKTVKTYYDKDGVKVGSKTTMERSPAKAYANIGLKTQLSPIVKKDPKTKKKMKEGLKPESVKVPKRLLEGITTRPEKVAKEGLRDRPQRKRISTFDFDDTISDRKTKRGIKKAQRKAKKGLKPGGIEIPNTLIGMSAGIKDMKRKAKREDVKMREGFTK